MRSGWGRLDPGPEGSSLHLQDYRKPVVEHGHCEKLDRLDLLLSGKTNKQTTSGVSPKLTPPGTAPPRVLTRWSRLSHACGGRAASSRAALQDAAGLPVGGPKPVGEGRRPRRAPIQYSVDPPRRWETLTARRRPHRSFVHSAEQRCDRLPVFDNRHPPESSKKPIAPLVERRGPAAAFLRCLSFKSRCSRRICDV